MRDLIETKMYTRNFKKNKSYLDFISQGEKLDPKTKVVANFYEDEPFPNYDKINSRKEIKNAAEVGQYSKALFDLIPIGGKCLEIGCGTGQLTNYLGLKENISVIGMDLSKKSLEMAAKFKMENSIHNTTFVRADLFDHPFHKEAFDVVIANGVLHHTIDTWRALEKVATLVKNNGYAVIGLYNIYGRWRTNLLRQFSNILGRKLLKIIEPMKNKKQNVNTMNSWINDQYFHPLERSHTYDECLIQGEKLGLSVQRFIPDVKNYMVNDNPLVLSKIRSSGNYIDRLITQIVQGIIENADGGLFVTIYKKEQ